MNQKKQLHSKSPFAKTFMSSRSMSVTVTVNFLLAPINGSKKLFRCLSTTSINDKNYSSDANTEPYSKKQKKRKNDNESPLHHLAKSKKIVTRDDIIELHKRSTE